MHSSSASHHWGAYGKAVLLALTALLLNCFGMAAVSPAFAAAPHAISVSDSSPRYVDATLGFSVELSRGWTAAPEQGPSTPANASTVIISNTKNHAAAFFLSVLQMSNAIAVFSSKGIPTTMIGSYPAVAQETAASSQFHQSCSSRYFVAGTDYVDAQWCGPSAHTQQSQILHMVATYQPGDAGIHQQQGRGSNVQLVNSQVHPAEDCTYLSEHHSAQGLPVGWGVQIGTPTDTTSPSDSTWQPTPGWDKYNPGAYICSNGNPAPYEGGATDWFQCTELVNRFIWEQWSLGAYPNNWYLTGNAAQYLDHDYTGPGGKPSSGTADMLADAQIIYDAQWGTNTTPPEPGDILVWQDVMNTSNGLFQLNGAGHTAVVTGTDGNFVYVAQQNDLWSKGCGYTPPAPCENAYMAYKLQVNTNGHGWSVDLNNKNGVTGRILRGWIHFTENDSTRPANYESAFQANTSDLFTVGMQPATGTDMLEGMMSGTNPSIATLSGGGHETAFQANNTDLVTVGDQPATGVDTHMGMASGTSPSIAALSGGGYEIAFQANTSHLFVTGTAGTQDLQFGMMPGTSPAIAPLPNGGYEVAFQSNNGQLWITGPAGAGYENLQFGMMNGTSPAITQLSNGGYEIAFQANTGNLWTVGTQPAAGVDMQEGMMAGTSPSIAAVSSSYEIAFEANTGNLYVVGTQPATGVDMQEGMKVGTNPSIIAIGSGFEIAFEGNNNELFKVGTQPATGTDMQEGMMAGTSPSITAG